MEAELRVTVVATGLGRTEEVSRPVPAKVVDNTMKTNGEIDYGELDRPTITRTGGRGSMRGAAVASAVNMEPQSDAVAKVATHQEADMDYLDIPAFLRRQAD